MRSVLSVSEQVENRSVQRDPFNKVGLGSGRAMHGGETLSSPPEFLRELVREVSLGKSPGGEEGVVGGLENGHHLLENMMHCAD